MRLSRLYQAQKLFTGSELNLDRESAHYLGKVLRLKPGDGINLFNDEDGEFAAEVVELERSRVVVRITAAIDNVANPQLKVNLGLGLTRGERMDYAIQKSTELGVSAITPLVTEYCEVKLSSERLRNKMIHWQRVAISASEQCGRSSIPQLNIPVKFAEWFEHNPAGILLDASGDTTLASCQAEEPLCVMTGPEGGFSQDEVALARQHDYHIVTLGPRILRAETAPVAALSLLQYRFGDLG